MRAVLVTTLLVLFPACATFEPFDPPVAGEMHPGPGLLSGPDGAFILSRGDAESAPETAPDSKASTQQPRPKLTDPPPE